MEDQYKTITKLAEGLYKEKGSKFIASIHPVRTEEEVKQIVSDIKEYYYDARHHCYAYALGAHRERTRAVDDGEPSSTAGKPILGQIVSHDLTNVLIVVVRYFGGTKLGVSGLINAYKEASIDAIANAEIIEKTVDVEIDIVFGYLVMNDVMKIIKDEMPEIISRDFQLDCKMTLCIRQSMNELLIDRLSKVEGLRIDRVE
ncbi:MAG: IMPACT family protein [Marinifilaceae bacterium]